MATAAPAPASGSTAATDNPNPGSSSSSAPDSGNQDSTFECNICLDTAKDAVISLCGHLFCGWRQDPTDKCVRCVKLASAGTKLSPYTGGEAQVNKTPEKEHLLDHRGKDLSQKTVVDFKALVLEMEGSKCRLESARFRLVFLLQLSTSMTEGLLQVFMFDMSPLILVFFFLFYLRCINTFCLTISQTAAPGTPQHMDEQFLSRLFLFVALVIMFWLLIA
uniref:E3 ubiquitin-protein ligase RNF185 n=1 Tax=Labrus bergylta TaxID=56723 RepID=A0A3Q3G2W5_9LABR